MRSTEARAAGELAGRAVGSAVGLLGEFHAGIAGRPFGALGGAATPVRVVHDGISRAVYDRVADGLRVAARGGGALAAQAARPEGRSLTERPVAAFALGALAGAFGSHMEDSELAVRMELRAGRGGAIVEGEHPAAAVPEPTGQLVVFVHGLCETEGAWWLPARGTRRPEPGTVPERVRSYGDRLHAERDYTPLYLRYNTGRHISENGRDLAEQLEAVLAHWPVAVERLVLVGHSMGGLVARSACHFGETAGHRWAEPVSHVFCLGTPHLGADLEKGTNIVSWGLAKLPETRPLARALNWRSAGIKDLRFGSCAETDWSDCDPDEFLRDRCDEVPFLPHARYFFVGAALSPAPLGRMFGDLLVRMPSASGRGNGRGRRIPFEVGCGLELSGLTHFDLLCHPAVLDQLRRWLPDS
jgi:pimeloyl-ACP methyl ester carboxylesterase